jgi:hypothetical protein
LTGELIHDFAGDRLFELLLSALSVPSWGQLLRGGLEDRRGLRVHRFSKVLSPSLVLLFKLPICLTFHRLKGILIHFWLEGAFLQLLFKLLLLFLLSPYSLLLLIMLHPFI